MVSSVVPLARERYERHEEQIFREWVRRNVDNAVNLASNINTLYLETNIKTFMLEFVIDGGGAAIAPGIKGDLFVSFSGVLKSVALLADQTGSIVIDIWVDTYANFPPDSGDSIAAAAKPTISASNKSQDTTLVGWDSVLTSGSVLRFNVDSCSAITRCTVALTVLKT